MFKIARSSIVRSAVGDVKSVKSQENKKMLTHQNIDRDRLLYIGKNISIPFNEL